MKERKEKGSLKEVLGEVKKLKEKLGKAEEVAEERLNHLKYLQADVDNLGKRYEKEKRDIVRAANESLVKELLVVLDSFDAAIKITKEGENKQGLLVLEKKFFDILATYGLGRIEAMGKRFNSDFHEALFREFSERQDNEIIEVIQKGYTFNSKVIRTSKVKVSKGLKDEDKSENNKES